MICKVTCLDDVSTGNEREPMSAEDPNDVEVPSSKSFFFHTVLLCIILSSVTQSISSLLYSSSLKYSEELLC